LFTDLIRSTTPRVELDLTTPHPTRYVQQTASTDYRITSSCRPHCCSTSPSKLLRVPSEGSPDPVTTAPVSGAFSRPTETRTTDDSGSQQIRCLAPDDPQQLERSHHRYLSTCTALHGSGSAPTTRPLATGHCSRRPSPAIGTHKGPRSPTPVCNDATPSRQLFPGIDQLP
jgi:hypothetical protein